MANVNSLMSSSSSATSSLYGTRNVLTGLASGMDTESMIENSVSGYKAKVTQLQQQQTKYEWKQDAYRSITDKLYAMNQTYTSYTSKTNLYSNAFFNNSVTTGVTATGAAGAANVDKVSATGKSSSDIEILAAQTATAARYSVNASALSLNIPGATGGSAIQTGQVTVGALNGSMTFSYNSQTVEISFDESDTGITDAEKLKDAITKKLSEQNIGSQKASDLIGVSVSGNQITFTDKENSGASPYISSVSGNITAKLGVTSAASAANATNPTFSGSLEVTKSMAEYLNGKELNVTLDGVSKSVTLSGLTSSGGALDTASLKNALQTGINQAFGNGKVTVDITADGKLSFSANDEGSTLAVAAKKSDVGEKLGIGTAGVTSYLNTGSSIADLLGSGFFADSGAAKSASGVSMTAEKDQTTGNDSTEFFKGSDGNRYQKARENGSDVYYRVDDKGERLFELTINDKSIYVSKNSSLESVMNSINSSDMGVKASYSQLTGKFVFSAKETGAANGISFDNGLAQKLFFTDANGNAAGVLTGGTDATVVANVNGEQITLNRASNTINMDGLSVNLKDSFGNVTAPSTDDAVSFKTSSDADSVIKTVKEFIESYNAILKEVHDAYATQPAEKSSSTHAKYEPLTDDDKATMSETAIKSYEEKAKQGLLFGDSDLSALYSQLVGAFSTGSNAADLRAMGISTSYSSNLTQIKLDESKLRSVLESDPDKVRDAFTKSKEGGASSDGLMTSIKNTLEQYASTSIGSPGLLVKKAGSTFSSTSLLNNAMQTQIDSVQTQIEKWQTKMSSKIDYYTRQFTALEKLMNTMNSQSSALAGLMGGY